MSEDLRKQLTSRLQQSPSSLKKHSKTQSVGKLQPIKPLVPKLAVQRMKSLSNLATRIAPLSSRLLPISSARDLSETQPRPKHRAFNKNPAFKAAKQSPQALKSPQVPGSKVQLPPLRNLPLVHDDGRLVSDREGHALEMMRTLKDTPEFEDEFCYCHMKQGGYELYPVLFNEKNPENFLTLSARGVTHFVHGVATFIPLDEWEREHKLFNALKQINFFQQYKKWKNFTLWKTFRRRNMFLERAQFLEKELLFLDAGLRSTLAEVRTRCWPLLSKEVVDFASDETRSLSQFLADQTAQRLVTKQAFKAAEQRIKGSVLQTCTHSVESYKNFHQLNEAEAEEGYPFLKGDLSSKPMPYTQVSLIRAYYKRIKRFIRLCDYLVVDLKLQAAMGCVSRVYLAVSQESALKLRRRGLRKVRPLFQVQVLGDGLKPAYQPELLEFKEAVEKSMKRGLKVLLKNTMMVYSTDFMTFTRVQDEYGAEFAEEELDLLKKGLEDPANTATMGKVTACLDQAISKVLQFCKRYAPLLRILDQNSRMTVAVFDPLEVDQVREAIDTYHAQQQTFEDIPDREDLEVFQLDIRGLKAILLPSPANCLSKISQFLPEVTEKRTRALTAYLHQANRSMQDVPETVRVYVQQSKALHQIEEGFTELSDNINELKDVMRLMETYSVPFPSFVQREFTETLTLSDTLRQRCQRFNERAEADRLRFSRELKTILEKATSRAAALKERLEDPQFANKESSPVTVLALLSHIQKDLKTLVEDTEQYATFQTELGMEPQPKTDMKELQKDFKRKQDMWQALHDWHKKLAVWRESVFAKIDVELISAEVDAFYSVAKQSRPLEDSGSNVPQFLREKVEELKDTMPVVIDLRSKCLQPRHWAQLHAILGPSIDIHDKNFKLKHLLAMQVNQIKDKVAEVALRARKEQELAQQLEELVRSWDAVELAYHYDRTSDSYLLVQAEPIVNKLDESLVKLNQLMTNRFIEPLSEEVENWLRQFRLFSATFEEWLHCQAQWAKLERIFKNSDISKKMKDKYHKFMSVDKQYKAHMKSVAEKTSLALPVCTKQSLFKAFKDWNNALEKLQKNLEEYLNKQRSQFPRFYFLSNDELIQLLSVANEVTNVQPFLKNIFDSVHEIVLDDLSIKAIVSVEKERVPMPSSTKAKGNIEEWLRGLETAMQKTLKRLMQEAVRNYEQSRDFFLAYPAQIGCLIAALKWCAAVEEALNTDPAALSECSEAINTVLFDLTDAVKKREPLCIRRRYTALIIQEVHNRDVVEALRDEEVSTTTDFKWQRQLRYYWHTQSDHFVVRQMNSEIVYGYEFLGAPSRLVVTPLTERCWLTITSALKLHLWANPTGPAGTGKTESTKDLAKALGKLCIVLNCSEQFTAQMIERLLVGLCSTGAWACLDEFNRIHSDVLSVTAQYLVMIKQSKDQRKAECFVEDKKVLLNPGMGVFVTMNPHYIGRSELPSNLKALFRPVAMVSPKFTLITQVMLYAEGFQEAKRLSRKVVQLYHLAEQQMSRQDHYDFGLRAIKSVLILAGTLKRRQSTVSEEALMAQAVCEANLPKFVADDIQAFSDLVTAVFSSIEVPQTPNEALASAVTQALHAAQLQAEPSFVDKVLQIHQTLQVRLGLILVGPAGSGKTTAYRTLAEALPGTEHQLLNPKAVDISELFGCFNPVTLDWKDGLASSIIRDYAQRNDRGQRWIVFDGPVDSVWVENMNSVLDDNRTLCLANQERIRLKKNMRVFFEVLDLAAASPATISRCGVVFFHAETIPLRILLESWIARSLSDWEEHKREYLRQLVSTHVPRAVQIVRKNLKEFIPTVDAQLIASFCQLVNSLTAESPRLRDEFPTFKRFIDKVFVFAIVWGIGGALDTPSMVQYDNAISSELKIELPKGSLYNSFVCGIHPGGEFIPWENHRPTFQYSPECSSIRVPTNETVKYETLLQMCIRLSQPVILTGKRGVGKSVIVEGALAQLVSEYQVASTAFSVFTSSTEVREFIQSEFSMKKKDELGGAGSKKVVMLVDDVNMPARGVFGAQPAVELLRQFCDTGCFHKDNRCLTIVDTTLLCVAAPRGGDRSVLASRFMRHLQSFSVPDSSEELQLFIFKSVMTGFAEYHRAIDLANAIGPLVSATTLCFELISKQFLPVPSKSHYTFSLRDLVRVFEGICMAQNFRSGETIITLWVHEHLRVYADRLVETAERRWLCDTLLKIIGQHFRRTFQYDELFSQPILFCDYLQGHLDMDEREYKRVPDLTTLHTCTAELIRCHNLECNRVLDIVLFDTALEHICRMCRVLRQPQTNVLLIGISGCGKQVLARLSAFICKSECVQIIASKDYTLAQFKEDIRKVYDLTGLQNQQCTFLINCNQLADERLLEVVDRLLKRAHIPNLYTPDELENIETSMLAEKASLNDFFANIAVNLHMVLCLTPAGGLLRKRIRMFPSLVTACYIDWFEQWPADALMKVAVSKLTVLEDRPLSVSSLAQFSADAYLFTQDVAELCLATQQRRVYWTPKAFVDMLNHFLKLLDEKQGQLTTSKSMYVRGVRELKNTGQEVERLEGILTELRPKLEAKQQESIQMAAKLEADSAEANATKERVFLEERELNRRAGEMRVLQERADADLKEALPMLEEAVKAVMTISASDIAEIRTFANPPPLVLFTLEAIAVLFEISPTWESIRTMLQQSFLDKLQHFPKDHMKPQLLKKLREKIQSNPEFTPENVSSHNRACKSLCQWVFAIEHYTKVASEVGPKRLLLEEMNRGLKEAAANLASAQARLEEELARVQALEAEVQRVSADKQSLDEEIRVLNDRLDRASFLTVGLTEEAKRWQEKAFNINEQMQFLVGDCLLTAAAINYFGPFNAVLRNTLSERWMKSCDELQILVSPEYSLLKQANQALLRQWILAGLPQDSASIENAIIALGSNKWPLMIDPQNQASHWVKRLEETNRVKQAKATDRDLGLNLKACMEDGTPLLIEDMGEALSPSIMFFFQAKLQEHLGGKWTVQYGDYELPYNPNFRLYMTTKLRNPYYLPDVYISVNIVDFSVSIEALEEQLLADIVKKEAPTLEASKNKSIKELSAIEKELEATEEALLSSLYQIQGNVLDNEQLVSKLQTSKNHAIVLAKKKERAERVQKGIEERRLQYVPVAHRGALLYFLVADLAHISHMYQYSLTYFLSIFTASNPSTTTDVATRVDQLVASITTDIFMKLSKSLFSLHRFLFSFLLALTLLKDQGQISQLEWDFVLKNKHPVISNKLQQPPLWPKTEWNAILTLQSISPAFAKPKIGIQVSINPEKWLNWLRSESFELPPEPFGRIDKFRQLLLAKALRPEKLVYVVHEFVQHTLGHEFVQPLSPPILQVYKETKATSPLLFILSPEADPTTTLMKLAFSKRSIDRLDIVSMGSGQGDRARKAVERGAREGKWVVLQNCHLSKQWMPELARLVSSLPDLKANLSEEFRLILTSIPCEEFPPAVLQTSVKFAIETTHGFKPSILKGLNTLFEEEFIPLEGNEKATAVSRLACSLVYFHAVVKERSKYGPAGWLAKYDFSETDLDASLQTVKDFGVYQDSQWEALRFVIGEIHFGGRVTEKTDRKCIRALVEQFISPNILNAQGYAFPPEGRLVLPADCSAQVLREHVLNLPEDLGPENVHLHQNARIAVEQTETTRLLSLVMAISVPHQTKRSLPAEVEQETWAITQKLQEELPNFIMLSEASRPLDRQSVLIRFLIQEVDRLNELLRVVRVSVDTVRKALEGLVLVSDDLEILMDSLHRNQVPPKWKALDCSIRRSLSSWVASLAERAKSIRQWVQQGSLKAYWLGAFVYPLGFLTALSQNYSKKYEIPIDELSLAFDFQSAANPEELEAEEDGVFVEGLLMENCQWDPEEMHLVEPPYGHLHTTAPTLLVIPTDSPPEEAEDYPVPLFKYRHRADGNGTAMYLLSVPTPTAFPAAHWVLRGAAYLCEPSDT